MAAAGIDTETFQAHALRGAVASKHLERGEDEIDVMARGGWSSNSVFRTFYARTKHEKVTLERLRSAQGTHTENLSAGAYEQPRVRGTAHDVEPTGSDAGPGKTTASRSAARGRRSLRAKPQTSLTHTENLSAGAHEQPCGSGTAHDIEPKGSDAGRDKTKASRRAAKKRRPARAKALDWFSEPQYNSLVQTFTGWMGADPEPWDSRALIRAAGVLE